MKNILKLLNIIILGAFLLVSCNMNDYPEFDDKNAFVAFDKPSYSVKEDEGRLEVAITLASVAGISTTITCELINGPEAVKDEDPLPAKEGVNFKLVGDGSLTFTSEARTQILEIDIIDKDTEYLGDLNFSIKFSTTGDVVPGEADICAVIITEQDHPLHYLFGDYNGRGVSHWQAPTASIWEVNLKGDDDDKTIVWIDNLPFVHPTDSSGFVVYGVVNADKTELKIPLNQIVPKKAKDGKNLMFWGLKGKAAPYDYVTEGNLTLMLDAAGKITFPTNMGMAMTYGETVGEALGLVKAGDITLAKQIN